MTYSYYKLLKKIEQRPAMWIGDYTLKSLSIYLNGYNQALYEYQLEEEIVSINLFHDWIAKKLGFYESTAGWANMILATSMKISPQEIDWENFNFRVTNSQHKHSFKLFYELLDEFINECT